MKKSIMLLTVLILSACQTTDPLAKAEEPCTTPGGCCPISKIDTHKQKEMCEHFAGEEPYDDARAAYLKRKMNELNCGLYF